MGEGHSSVGSRGVPAGDTSLHQLLPSLLSNCHIPCMATALIAHKVPTCSQLRNTRTKNCARTLTALKHLPAAAVCLDLAGAGSHASGWRCILQLRGALGAQPTPQTRSGGQLVCCASMISSVTQPLRVESCQRGTPIPLAAVDPMQCLDALAASSTAAGFDHVRAALSHYTFRSCLAVWISYGGLSV